MPGASWQRPTKQLQPEVRTRVRLPLKKSQVDAERTPLGAVISAYPAATQTGSSTSRVQTCGSEHCRWSEAAESAADEQARLEAVAEHVLQTWLWTLRQGEGTPCRPKV